jgi:hypothetical protein
VNANRQKTWYDDDGNRQITWSDGDDTPQPPRGWNLHVAEGLYDEEVRQEWI